MDESSDRRWAPQQPTDRAWKGRSGRNRHGAILEQDRAAGGRDRRWLELSDGRLARASVELKMLPRTRRIRAYLRWSENGRSPTHYLGEVGQATRAANLAEGWRLAWGKGLLAPSVKTQGSWASTPAVRSSMVGNKGRDTGPERRLRSLLHRAGLRYRVSISPLPELRRTADVVFTTLKIAVFVDGCYWHGCPEHYRPSSKNSDYWNHKLESNRSRDTETNQLLDEAGWTVIRIWEHEDSATACRRVAEAVLAARSESKPGPELSPQRTTPG